MSFRKLRRCEAGTAAIEFAIIGMALILVSVGTIGFGRGLLIRNELSYAADLAARRILMSGTVSEEELETEIRAGLTSSDPQRLELVIETDTSDAMSFRILTLSYPFNPLIPGLGELITVTVERRIPDL